MFWKQTKEGKFELDQPTYFLNTDFDESGSYDITLSKYYKGDRVPVRGRYCSSQQMLMLKQKFPTYASFASASMEDMFTPPPLSGALHYEAKTFASIFLENLSNHQFEPIPSPIEAQTAPCNAILIEDFNKDGYLDVLLGGNMLDTEVETPSYDAGKGLLLLGNANKNFKTIPYKNTTLQLDKNLKQLSKIILN